MKGIFLCLMLLAVACDTATVQIPVESSVDSMVAQLKNTVNPLLNNNQTTEAQKKLDSLKPEVDQLNHYRLTGAWLRCASVRCQLDDQYDSAKIFAEQALALAEQNDTAHKEIIGAKIQLAEVLRLQHAYDSSLQLSQDAYYLARKYDTAGLPLICMRLAQLYNAINDQSQRRKYLWEGYMRSTSAVHRNVLANHIADYYDQVGKTDSAIYFLKSLDRDTSFNNPYYFGTRYENIGTLLTKQNKPGEGLQYQLKAFEINRGIGALDAQSYYDLTAAYSKLQQFNKAAAGLDTALTLASQQRDLHLITAIWKARADNQLLQKHYAEAYEALDAAYAAFQKEMDSSFVVKARELETKYEVRSKDERIAALARTNAANDQIRNLQVMIIVAMVIVFIALIILFTLLWKRRQLKVQLQAAELEQQLLRSRMEPHFIFNTLAVLQSFIRNEAREKSLQYLGSFSKLLRLSLENSRQGFVLLKEEIEALKSYLSLQVTNLENKFEYAVTVDEQLYKEAVMIPPMLIQPFVENAVVHGVTKIDYKGMIVISLQKENDVLHCIVEDNGTGLSHASPGNTLSHATQLIRKRLSLFARQTKQEASLTILDKRTLTEGSGVKVVLRIGLIRKAVA
jgi:two-component sensor histidine kinase